MVVMERRGKEAPNAWFLRVATHLKMLPPSGGLVCIIARFETVLSV
jgi:hypothetical protein